ncbi:serine/threonine/tyrosine-interacting-like protein 1 isoform X4 [Sorex araneus]|uniref:serine/threonine/tyrosine-interacting-like protein 1 isoform X4 n=1 Tax=Sorex araneus TaxID=42254 RepID=UPI0024335C92|nr:serine/threonine/tyrosine-interacting-like protein 1 isoform X4 [Sorex araneus]
MAGLALCEPKELYNILNQVTKLSRLTEPNYLCLLDVRPKQDYDESHVITAHRVKKELDAFKPYPFEVLDGQVYLGNFAQACDPQIQKDLKIKAHINVSTESTPFFVGDSDRLLHIQVRDSVDCILFPFLRLLCHFAGHQPQLRGHHCLPHAPSLAVAEGGQWAGGAHSPPHPDSLGRLQGRAGGGVQWQSPG